MNDLNEEQQKAVLSESNSIAIVAGPGTGKTKTLTSSIEYLIKNKKVPPDKILALTFTKKAAKEMKDRLQVKQKPFVGTFHALALYLLKIEPNIITKEQQLEIVTKQDLKQISTSKNNLKDTELVKKYNQKLQELNLKDYDDLLLMLYKELKIINLKLKIDYVLVDEFQDTNPLQYKILRLLKAKNYFVIGDPNQSIYGFRGTNEKIFDDFYKDYPDTLNFTLTKNYRSTPKVTDTYNLLFENKLTSVRQDLGEVYLLETLNEFSEADWIVNFIKQKAGGLDLRDASEANANFSDFAILYRTHHFSRILQKKFEESGIPFQIVGGESATENQQIEDLIKINCVTLLTMHASKGLEFEYVFLCGCEQGLIPYKKSDLDEEKRLFYVALSRARRGLYLTKAKIRSNKPKKQSQFLDNLNLEIKSDEEAAKKEQRVKLHKLKKSQLSMF